MYGGEAYQLSAILSFVRNQGNLIEDEPAPGYDEHPDLVFRAFDHHTPILVFRYKADDWYMPDYIAESIAQQWAVDME